MHSANFYGVRGLGMFGVYLLNPVNIPGVGQLVSPANAAFKFDNAAALGKARPLGSEGFRPSVRYVAAIIVAALPGAGPCIEDQRPFALGGGMSGKSKGKQQRCGDEGFHGYFPSCVES